MNSTGQEEYDVPVKAGEIVHLLDDSDRGWYWVCKPDGTEGYVPSNYISEINEDSINDVGIPKQELSVIKSFQNDLPTSWKVTNDLKGKSPVPSTCQDTTAVRSDKQKQKPLKPPRKKKNKQSSISPSLNDSMDSIDIYITDSSAEYLDYENKSSYDELSPRSNVFSDSSILDSSYSEIYNHGQNFLSELSPRSIDSENFNLYGNNTDMDETAEASFTQEICCQTHKPRNSVKKDECAYASTNNNKNSRDIRQCKQGIEDDRRSNENDDVQQLEQYMSTNRNHISNSIKSKPCHNSRHKRPLSMPAFKSYQEYKNDYYDEYFYEDTDTEFSSRSRSNVVNVSEILKMRKRNEQRKQIRKSESCVEDRNNHHNGRNFLSTERERNEGKIIVRGDKKKHVHNKPKMKQFLLDLPSAKQEQDMKNIQNGKPVENVNNTNANFQKQVTKSFNLSNEIQFASCVKHADKGFERNKGIANICDKRYILQADTDIQVTKPMFRQFNSYTDLTQTEMKNQTEKARKDEIKTRSTDLARIFPENKDKNLKQGKNTYLRAYSSSTDLREIRGKPDWSFGYPRKTRRSIGRTTTETSGTCNESTRRKEDRKYRKSKDEHKDETRKGTHEEINVESVVDRVSLEKFETENFHPGKEESTSKINDSTESVENSFNDETMMALLRQTDSLLQKTGHLLGDDRTQVLREKRLDQGFDIGNNMSTFDTELEMTPTADEKCNKFLKNNTIGIHGMIYIVTEDSIKNHNQDSEIHITSKTKDAKEVKDSRKEKSNVMKENSSKMVSAELKTLDLQDIRGITEFVCQCDYEPDTDNMLPIKHGEILHIGLDGQDSGEWYWAFSPRLRKNGFVPKKFVKIPMVTII